MQQAKIERTKIGCLQEEEVPEAAVDLMAKLKASLEESRKNVS